MIRRGRLRTFTLWAGTLLCVLIAAAFVVSAWWFVVLQVSPPRGSVLVLAAGSTMLAAEIAVTGPDSGRVVVVRRSSHGLAGWNDWSGELWVYLRVPLYGVFAAVAIPTLLVWRFWPKAIKPGHCRCGYDLRGNQSGKCPECGIEVQR